jgi:HK97 family phage prohead protease
MKFEAKDIIGKKFEIKSELESVDTENATAVFVLSTVDIDRHGDVVDQETMNFKNFMNNPVFLEQHMSWEFPLGKFVEIWQEEDPNRDDNALRTVGKVKFAVEEYERAKVAFALVANGFMTAVSVGFIPHDVKYMKPEGSDDGFFLMKDCELLEVSLVSVPANPHALAKMVNKADAKGIDMAPLLERPTKKEMKKVEETPEPSPKQKLIDARDTIVKQSPNSRATHLVHKAIREIEKDLL